MTSQNAGRTEGNITAATGESRRTVEIVKGCEDNELNSQTAEMLARDK